MLRQFDVPVDDENVLLKDYCGISKDGTYEIEYEDIYGNSYTEQFTLEDFFGDYSAQIQYSTTEKTKEDVVATIEGVSENAQISLKRQTIQVKVVRMTAKTKKIPVTLIRSAGISRNQRQRSCSTKTQILHLN